MPEMTGGCLCGQVRYSANGEPAFVGVCHCRNCQKQTGTAFSVLVGVPKTAMSLQGRLKTFATRATAVNRLTGISARSVDHRSSLTLP
jgi:hypothetical protein